MMRLEKFLIDIKNKARFYISECGILGDLTVKPSYVN